jgi:ATP citrate (pro-S)-lyase
LNWGTGEEPSYAGVAMSTIIEKEYGVGDVISLLWFKRSLPHYCTKFIEVTACFYMTSPCSFSRNDGYFAHE